MTFDEAFAIVIGNEGGYVDHPADPGGETNYGISRRAYPAGQAGRWREIGGDELPW